ncbi:hypothetical protein RHMOL_Rhmol12G0243800 [Rhododendron molle]|uniref:Uncharacterized protein n=1 Tax=Rhododendron molle TaxID=49168 RepID=A0ACC0LM29_RHOML|nr:hypothetical protein RHMOL_Rhmol12G0243800 [Rhododendron molle]
MASFSEGLFLCEKVGVDLSVLVEVASFTGRHQCTYVFNERTFNGHGHSSTLYNQQWLPMGVCWSSLYWLNEFMQCNLKIIASCYEYTLKHLSSMFLCI